MKKENYEVERLFKDIPVSPQLKILQTTSEQQDDPEAIEWSEVRHLLFQHEWGPILELPVTRNDFFLQRQFDEDGVDVSAFNTHDFERYYGESERYIYALGDAVRETQRAYWTFEMIFNRIKSPAKYLVLRYTKQEVIEPDMCEDIDMWQAGLWYRRFRRAAEKLRRMKEARWKYPRQRQ